MNNFLSTISGFIAGSISSVICYPLQIIQVQQQVSNNKRTVIDSIKNIYQKQGLRGYYYGLNKGVLCYSIFYGSYFYTYDWLKESTELSPFVKSYLASTLGSIISNPWQVVRVRRQTCILNGQLNFKPSIRQIYQQEGIISLTKGLKLTLFKNIELGLVMTITEKLKTDYQVSQVYASFTGKIIAASLTYPLDCARNIRRYEPITYRKILRRFYNNPKKMYYGMPAYLIKSVPACVISFTINDMIKQIK